MNNQEKKKRGTKTEKWQSEFRTHDSILVLQTIIKRFANNFLETWDLSENIFDLYI